MLIFRKEEIFIKSKLSKINKKIEDNVVNGYQKIENSVVDSYKKIENSVVNGYQKIEDKFIDKYLTKDGETLEEAKIRIKNEERKNNK